MIIARKSLGFVGIPLLTTVNGITVVPDALPSGSIYRVDPGSGTATLDPSMGASGLLTFAQVGAVQSLYNAPLNISEAAFEQYHIRLSFFKLGTEYLSLLTLIVSAEFQTIQTNATASHNGQRNTSINP